MKRRNIFLIIILLSTFLLPFNSVEAEVPEGAKEACYNISGNQGKKDQIAGSFNTTWSGEAGYSVGNNAFIKYKITRKYETNYNKTYEVTNDAYCLNSARPFDYKRILNYKEYPFDLRECSDPIVFRDNWQCGIGEILYQTMTCNDKSDIIKCEDKKEKDINKYTYAQINTALRMWVAHGLSYSSIYGTADDPDSTDHYVYGKSVDYLVEKYNKNEEAKFGPCNKVTDVLCYDANATDEEVKKQKEDLEKVAELYLNAYKVYKKADEIYKNVKENIGFCNDNDNKTLCSAFCNDEETYKETLCYFLKNKKVEEISAPSTIESITHEGDYIVLKERFQLPDINKTYTCYFDKAGNITGATGTEKFEDNVACQRACSEVKQDGACKKIYKAYGPGAEGNAPEEVTIDCSKSVCTSTFKFVATCTSNQPQSGKKEVTKSYRIIRTTSQKSIKSSKPFAEIRFYVDSMYPKKNQIMIATTFFDKNLVDAKFGIIAEHASCNSVSETYYPTGTKENVEVKVGDITITCDCDNTKYCSSKFFPGNKSKLQSSNSLIGDKKCASNPEKYDRYETAETNVDPSMNCILNACNENNKNEYLENDAIKILHTKSAYCKVYCREYAKFYLANKTKVYAGMQFLYDVKPDDINIKLSDGFKFTSIVEKQAYCVSELDYEKLDDDINKLYERMYEYKEEFNRVVDGFNGLVTDKNKLNGQIKEKEEEVKDLEITKNTKCSGLVEPRCTNDPKCRKSCNTTCINTCETENTTCESSCENDTTCINTCETKKTTCESSCENDNTPCKIKCNACNAEHEKYSPCASARAALSNAQDSLNELNKQYNELFNKLTYSYNVIYFNPSETLRMATQIKDLKDDAINCVLLDGDNTSIKESLKNKYECNNNNNCVTGEIAYDKDKTSLAKKVYINDYDDIRRNDDIRRMLYREDGEYVKYEDESDKKDKSTLLNERIITTKNKIERDNTYNTRDKGGVFIKDDSNVYVYIIRKTYPNISIDKGLGDPKTEDVPEGLSGGSKCKDNSRWNSGCYPGIKYSDMLITQTIGFYNSKRFTTLPYTGKTIEIGEENKFEGTVDLPKFVYPINDVETGDYDFIHKYDNIFQNFKSYTNYKNEFNYECSYEVKNITNRYNCDVKVNDKGQLDLDVCKNPGFDVKNSVPIFSNDEYVKSSEKEKGYKGYGFMYRSIDLENPFSKTRGNGTNWDPGINSDSDSDSKIDINEVINNIKSSANNIFTDEEYLDAQYVLNPQTIRNIKEYNRENIQSGGYRNNTITCNVEGKDQNKKFTDCKSSFFGEIDSLSVRKSIMGGN